MEQYEVGQILYTTSNTSFKIIPVQVVEEVIRTTIKGKEKTYMIAFPDEKKTVVDIKKIKGKTFKTKKGVEDYLLENTKQAIKELLKEADVIRSEAFGTAVVEEKRDILEKVVQPEFESDIIKIDLGNGQVGRVSKSNLKQGK